MTRIWILQIQITETQKKQVKVQSPCIGSKITWEVDLNNWIKELKILKLIDEAKLNDILLKLSRHSNMINTYEFNRLGSEFYDRIIHLLWFEYFGSCGSRFESKFEFHPYPKINLI